MGKFENYLQSNIQTITNKSFLITGISSGIGRACGEFLLEMGAKVYGVSRNKSVLKDLKTVYPNFNYISGDLNQENTLEEMEVNNFFKIDVLINNAGMALGKDLFHETSDEDNDLVLQTNINSAFKVARRALGSMRVNGIGDIVNICSIASHEAYKGGVVYCASKHALLAMGKALRHETHGENIRVVNISPGMVETNFSKVRFRGDENKAKQVYEGFSPLTAEDVAFQIIQSILTPRNVNIDEIIILATDQAGATKVKKS